MSDINQINDGDFVVLYDLEGQGWAVAADKTGTSPEPTHPEWQAIDEEHRNQVDLSGVGADEEDVAAAFESAFNSLTGFSAVITSDDSADDGTMTMTHIETGLPPIEAFVGSAIGGTLAGPREKTLTWQTPIQPTDRIQVWGSKDRVNWFPINGCFLGSTNLGVVPSMEAAGGVPRAGVNWRPGATAYETIVTFARYVNIANDDAPAENWPSSDAYWVATKSKAGQAVGFGTVSQYSAGLMPANLSNLDDATATRMGMKAYYHGTTYAGGNAPTVTGNNSWATTRAMFIPKQMQDGRWVLEFQIRGSVSGGALVTSNASINGIVTKNTTDFNQSLNANSGNGSFNAVAAGMAPNNNQIIFRHSSITPTEYYVSGLIELESKPTWAY